MALKLKIKKTLLKRKVEGVTKEGYYGRVITNGTKSFEDIVKTSTHGSTLDYREAELACKMMIDGIADSIKQGYIVDLGVLGKLYPAVNGKWDENADNLQLADMKPKVNYKAGEDIAAAVKGAQLSWTTEAETDENTVTDDDNTQTGGNTGGGETPSGELEG
jgi:nucleoid DNA-binding protein